MLRLLLFVHRYLAVAVGLLMALWCLSGFVMLYQGYPELTSARAAAGAGAPGSGRLLPGRVPARGH